MAPEQLPVPQEHQQVYDSPASALESEVDDSLASGEDNDSAFGQEDGRSRRTQSETSSVDEYRWENGRRYNAYQDGQYFMPDDEKEQDRLELQHQLFRLTAGGRLHLAPIPQDVQSVLDMGCGTGIWAMQFADEHPSASVLGIDLSPIQPTSVPPNCSFRITDAEAEWIAAERFDFIHGRALFGAFRNWQGVLQQAYNHLNPGGYIELQEFYFPAQIHGNNSTSTTSGERKNANCDTTENTTTKTATAANTPDGMQTSDSKLVQWTMNCIEAGRRVGLNMEAPKFFSQWLQEAGFVDIHMKWSSWPLGPWAKGARNKEVGRWALANVLDGLGAANAFHTRALGWSIDEVELFVSECRNELLAQKTHLYLPICFAYARKPREGEFALTQQQQQQILAGQQAQA